MHARVTARFDGRVAFLELSGRNGTNAMDERFVQDLDEVAATIADSVRDGRVDVVAMRARGRHFCVGGDLGDLVQFEDAPTAVTRMTGHAHRAIAALHRLEVPVIAAWQGAVAGGGIGLLLVADIIVAGASASMTAGYSAVGLSPDAGVSWSLTQRVGAARALDLLLSNRRIDAATALSLGIAAEVVIDGQLDARVAALVDQTLLVGASVVRATKCLVRQAPTAGLDAHLRSEAREIAAAAGGARFQATAAAYVRGSDGS